MNARQAALLEAYLGQISEEYRPFFRELAVYADSLGYRPARNKTQQISIDFRSSRVGRSIMKMDTAEARHDGYAYGERNRPGLRLRFFAAKAFSGVFRDAVRNVIEEFGGRYTGRYGCGRCNGNPQGYVYAYPDGRTVFRCGSELISVFDFEDCLDEIKALLRVQAAYDLQAADGRK